jgi:hypothetical protein
MGVRWRFCKKCRQRKRFGRSKSACAECRKGTPKMEQKVCGGCGLFKYVESGHALCDLCAFAKRKQEAKSRHRTDREAIRRGCRS